MDLEWVVLERHVWFCAVGFYARKKKSTVKKKTKIRKTRQQIHQGSLFLMDVTFEFIYLFCKENTTIRKVFLNLIVKVVRKSV